MVKKSSRRGGRRRSAPKRRKPTARPTQVEFRPVRRAVQQKIKELKGLEQSPQVVEVIGRMEECLAQVTQICGDNMLFPIR